MPIPRRAWLLLACALGGQLAAGIESRAALGHRAAAQRPSTDDYAEEGEEFSDESGGDDETQVVPDKPAPPSKKEPPPKQKEALSADEPALVFPDDYKESPSGEFAPMNLDTRAFGDMIQDAPLEYTETSRRAAKRHTTGGGVLKRVEDTLTQLRNQRRPLLDRMWHLWEQQSKVYGASDPVKRHQIIETILDRVTALDAEEGESADDDYGGKLLHAVAKKLAEKSTIPMAADQFLEKVNKRLSSMEKNNPVFAGYLAGLKKFEKSWENSLNMDSNLAKNIFDAVEAVFQKRH